MRYADIIGQETTIARLVASSEFYRKNGSTTEHVLIVADEGMGKRTIALALAGELGVPFQEVNALALEVLGDLTAILTNLRQNEILIVCDVHKLKRAIQDVLLEVLRNRKLTITIGQGASARRHVMDLKPFTLVGTTPKKSDCSEQLLSCFALVLHLQPYSNENLGRIGKRIAAQEGVEVEAAAMELLATNSRSCPGKLNALIRRVSRAVNKQGITEEDTLQAFAAFGIPAQTNISKGNQVSIDRMSGVEFERFVTELLARMKFRAEMTRATGDGGIDIIAILDEPILGGRYLFQCKRYASDNLVGASTVRDFYGAVTADKALKGILVTTSDFTPQAREFAERVGLELINFSQLQRLLAEHGMA